MSIRPLGFSQQQGSQLGFGGISLVASHEFFVLSAHNLAERGQATSYAAKAAMNTVPQIQQKIVAPIGYEVTNLQCTIA